MTHSTNKRILILAGEASGDLLSAKLIQAIHQQNPTITIDGMGGVKMRQAGAKILINSDEISVVGFFEILKQFSSIYAAMKKIKNYLKESPPDLVILVDYPGFNLRVAKTANKLGIKVLYYVSPQIWAWRYHRIHFIKKYIDKMAVLFSFEEKIYQKENVPVSFVGHPMVDAITPHINTEQICQQFNLKSNQPIIALLPGSRKQEIKRLMPIILKTIPLIQQKIPAAQFILPLASSLNINDIHPHLNAKPHPKITIIENNTYNVLPLCSAAITASGTVTLETALNAIPMAIIYKVNASTAWFARRFIKLAHIGLCNIIAENQVAKEFLQENAKPQSIADEVIELIENQNYRTQVIHNLNKVKENLGGAGATQKTADIALEML